MIILRNRDVYKESIELDCKTGNYNFITTSENNPVNGWFFRDEMVIIAFYKYKNALYLKINDIIMDIKNIVQIDIRKISKKGRELIIKTNLDSIINIKYTMVYEMLEWDPTLGGDDEETWDFGLWLKNCIEDPERIQIALDIW